MALLPIPGQRRAYGARDGDTFAAIQSDQRISFNDAKQVVKVGAQAGATAHDTPTTTGEAPRYAQRLETL